MNMRYALVVAIIRLVAFNSIIHIYYVVIFVSPTLDIFQAQAQAQVSAILIGIQNLAHNQ